MGTIVKWEKAAVFVSGNTKYEKRYFILLYAGMIAMRKGTKIVWFD